MIDPHEDGMMSGPKILLVVPDTNTTMAQEVRALWPDLAALERVGVPRPMRPIVRDDLPEYEAATLAAVRACPLKEPDIVLYGCTTAGFLGGPDGDRRMAAALAEATGAPVITTASSMVAALRESKVARPAIVTPYLDASNQALIRFLAAYGIEVSVLDSFYLKTVAEYDAMTKEQVRDFATRVGNTPQADGMFVACTQLPTLGILEGMGDTLSKPVRGAIEATVAAAKRELNTGSAAA
jgi:maleate cis-trans isomerase